MQISGFLKFSMIDYPGKLSAVVFTQGCDFRCPYCHNPELVVIKKGTISEKETIDFLKTRKGKLEGVVITGGEPTIQKDLKSFIRKTKKLGFKIKLDTNGSHSDILKNLIKEKLVDYIAMDIKSPFEKFQMDKVQSSKFKVQIKKSIELIMNSKIKYEFRTTIVKGDLNQKDIVEIAKSIKGARLYVLQKFKKSKHLNRQYKNAKTLSDREFQSIKKKIKKYVREVKIR